jgi:beta-lactamase family protein
VTLRFVLRASFLIVVLGVGACSFEPGSSAELAVPTYRECVADLNLDGVADAADREAWTDFEELVRSNPGTPLRALYQRRLNLDRDLGNDTEPDAPDREDRALFDRLLPESSGSGGGGCVETAENSLSGEVIEIPALLDAVEAMLNDRRSFLLTQRDSLNNNLGDFTQAVAAILYDGEVVGVRTWSQDPAAETSLHTLFMMGSGFKPITALSTLVLMDEEPAFLHNERGDGLDTPIDFRADVGLRSPPTWKHWRAYEYRGCQRPDQEAWRLCDGNCPDPGAVTPRMLLRHRSGLARDAGAYTRPPSASVTIRQIVAVGSQGTQIPLLGGGKAMWAWDDPNAWDAGAPNDTWSGRYPVYAGADIPQSAGTWRNAGTYTPRWAEIRQYFADPQTELFWYPQVGVVNQGWNYSNAGYATLAGMMDKFLYELDRRDPDVASGEERNFLAYVQAHFGRRSVGMDTFTMEPDWTNEDPAYRVRRGHFAPWLKLYEGVSDYRLGSVDSGRWQSVYGRGAGGSSWASVMDMANLVRALMRAGRDGGLPRHNEGLQKRFGDAHPAEHVDVLRGTGPEGAPLDPNTLQFDLEADGVCVDGLRSQVCDPRTSPTWLTATGRDNKVPSAFNYFTGNLFVSQNADGRQFWSHSGGGPGLVAYYMYSPETTTGKSLGVVMAANNRNAGLPAMVSYIVRRMSERDPPDEMPARPQPGGFVASDPALVLNDGPAFVNGVPVCH